MNKVRKLFNSLILSFVLMGIICAGIFISHGIKLEDKLMSSYADAMEYDTISNSLPQYFKIDVSSGNGAEVGKVDNTIYLFQSNSFKEVKIGDKVLTSGEKNQNYGYFSGNEDSAQISNQQEYYYFDFQNSLSLYYNLTNEQIGQGLTGTNLMQNQNIKNYAFSNPNAFVPTNYSFTPQQLNVKFKLNTSLENIEFGEGENKSLITLNKEGCYTLAVPLVVYYTNNGGLTFTSTETTIYYTFMVFNANTYFNSTTGLPNLTISSNIQQSVLAETNTYSRYYFYNFSNGSNTFALPTIRYNPNIYQIKINYTDIDQVTHSTTIEYSNGELVQYDELGNIISEENYFVKTKIDNSQAVLTFFELGVYDIGFEYHYKSQTEDGEIIYNLPLEELSSSSVFNNKNQRLYLYGYQSVYSDYATIDPNTNQPESVELKNIDFDNSTYSDSADITSGVNKGITAEDNEFGSLTSASPVISKSSYFNPKTLLSKTLEYIQSDENDPIKPISSNQTPIKFINNITLDSANSYIYNVTDLDMSKITADDLSGNSSYESKFQGFNQNNAGTYIYIIQYKFDNYMSTSGTLQSAYYHYQIFYFTVTNTTPTVTILDENYSEIFTNGYTNKNVYILNDSENNIYDAKVTITLSAKNYENGNYFFQDRDITELSSYGIIYQTFEKGNEENKDYNNLIAGKQGILIEKDSPYANAQFTVKILSANSNTPSVRTFTIDTNEISNVTSRNVSMSTSTTYKIGNTFSSYATNQPMIFSWDEKKSGAPTYGYVKYIPMESINYYSAQTEEDDLSLLLTYLLQTNKTLPVSYKINIASASDWTEYKNSYSYSTTINATYVKSTAGFYILEIYDQAGNSTFEIYLIDDTSPIFVQRITSTSVTRKLMTNSESISVPTENTKISIEWAGQKAIYLENLTDYTKIDAYKYGKDVTNANTKLDEVLEQFFNSNNNSNIKSLTGLGGFEVNGSLPAGIPSYNGDYLIIPIEDKAYLKDALHSTFEVYTSQNYEYEIQFINENDEAIEGTYKILLRDKSNTQITNDEATNYKNYPSGFLTFNVTSDASRLSVNFGNGNLLDWSSYSLTGNLYKDANGEYTHKPTTDDVENTETDLAYKFAYYTPINADNEINLTFIPVAENGSEVQSIVLYYYPYVVEKTQIGNKVYSYYTISDQLEQKIDVYKKSNVVYEPDEQVTYNIALGTSDFPNAGRYVIERLYIEGNNTDKYDYFKRTITFTVDDFNLISPLETVTDIDGENSSLESIVGGDIILSMYSGDNNSSIEVSFPTFNENGLNSGSFYTQDSFDSEDANITFSVEGNKLPMTLYIPQYKYTISTNSTINEQNGKDYSVTHNNDLSYYGNAYIEQNTETGYYDVYVEGIVVQTFILKQDAEQYLNNNIATTEYQIYAEVKFEPTNEGQTIYYYSNGTTTGGFLNLYQVDGYKGQIPEGAEPTKFFYQEGKYTVTIYQANNIGSTSSFYDFYKFGFVIKSQEPDFTIIGSDGYEINSANSTNTYYTNSDSLTIQWEVPTNMYQAKIDEEQITISSFPQIVQRSEIQDGTNIRYFTIDTSSLITANNSYLEITMQYEGFNSAYYRRVTKRIYFDRSAPTQNVQDLMTKTETATNKAFTKNYQEIYMRKYYDYKNEEQIVSADTDLSLFSYSYSIDSGYFKYYSYNVTTDFFNTTLRNTLNNASSYPYDTQNIYYRQIANLDDSYIQVDKSSFSTSNYTNLNLQLSSDKINLNCGYYEIVEMDYAKNMSVYIVYVIDSTNETDQNVRNDALTYTNAQHDEAITITNNQIQTGFNIYSNSDFTLQDINYKSDPWALFYIKIANQSEIRYMKSPWLSEGFIYKVIFNSSGIAFEQVELASLFETVESSSNKHTMTLTDRTNGTNSIIYLSIMDASLNTQKVEDPLKTSAILNISVPTNEQQQSTTTSYVFPTSVQIYQFDSTSTAEDKWKLIMIANQEIYGTWTPTDEFVGVSYITFETLATGTTLQIKINLGANASQKVKYIITDNFGNTTTVIQLANEVAYNEITGESTVYQLPESDGSITYISDKTIKFSYNTLLYTIEIYNKDNEDITSTIEKSENATNNISVYSLIAKTENNWDDYYRIVVKDSESDSLIKELHIRIYYKLPFLTNTLNDIPNGGILFNDKNQKPIEDIGNITSMTINFNGKPYTSSAQTITTYSQNVTIYFKDGQSLNYQGEFNYENGYPYSVYLSRDNGSTWELIDGESASTSGYTISGTGDYLIFIKYDSDTVFTNLCKIFKVTILDSSASYYYITVDGLNVEKSNMSYISSDGKEYKTNYFVSVNYLIDKNNRVKITPNEELNVDIKLMQTISTGGDVWIEVYYYSCSESVGDFTIIYIEETDNIVTQFTYETASGNTTSIKSSSSEIIVANKETENNFDKLKLNFTSFYGINENIVNVEVLKLFNGNYVEIYPTVYTNDETSYIYLEQAGSYRIKLYDSCTPANVQSFNGSDYIDIIFLNSTPFIVTTTNTDGTENITEPIQNAVYNTSVKLSLTNLSTYYQPSGYPTITVTRNGNTYPKQITGQESSSGYIERNHEYTFSEPGYYSVKFTATSTTGIPVREQEFNFTIINKNESRYAYEFTNYSNYYISKVVKDGVDITGDLIEISNFDTIVINGKTYLSELIVNYLDEKTGGGKYQITVCPNNSAYENTIGNEFTYEFWINMANPPINVSIPEGTSTTDNITITFNVQNYYNAIGDSYIKIGSKYYYYTSETLPTLGETSTLTITETGVYFIQIYTSSGHLLYSYKVEKSEPLNAFAIMAIVFGVIAVGAIIGITVALRKRQKVK